jgi:hypothetical protein
VCVCVDHYITGDILFVLDYTERVRVCPAIAINNHASCEICVVIRFLPAKNMSAVEIHLKLCAVYCPSVVREGTAIQRYGMLKRQENKSSR